MVHDISSATDYRRLAQHTNGLFFTPQEFSDPDAEAAAHFEALAAACHKSIGPASVEVMMGRHLPVPAACERSSSVLVHRKPHAGPLICCLGSCHCAYMQSEWELYFSCLPKMQLQSSL